MPTLVADPLLDLAIAEDLSQGDITTESIFTTPQQAKACFVTRQSAVISGVQTVSKIFHRIDPMVVCQNHVEDGDPVTPGTVLVTVSGSIQSILKGERLALNFLQHLSGIATLTYQFVGAVAGTSAKIQHTRKTTPSLRQLEIEAVIHGGGHLHRTSLADGILIKDNHIHAAGGIRVAVDRVRQTLGPQAVIEVECDTLAHVDEAICAGVNKVLLDNMDLKMLKDAVNRAKKEGVWTEASGGVTLRNAHLIAKTGVDFISTSQITISAPAVDIGLDFTDSGLIR